MPIKLIALDLDGTLLVDWHTMTAPVQAMVKAASEHGVKVVIATGREFTAATKFYHQLGLTTPIICFQGGLIHNAHTDETIAIHGLGVPLAHQLIDLARQQNLALFLYGRKQVFTENGSKEGYALLAAIGSPTRTVANLKQTINFSPIKGIVVQSPEEVAQLLPNLQARLDRDVVSVIRSLENAIEFIPAHVSKGIALATVAKYYGIAQNEVMAMGDQDNDVEMLAWAGLSVAMGNASDKAKAEADVIAPSVDQDGVAWAIQRFVL
jgi:Cof subfamily protein (haloacid dehalogenase superfamily)